MTLFALGINHNTAPVSIRERLAFPADQLKIALLDLIKIPAVREAAILSTCNRTEFYCGIEADKHPSVIDWIVQRQQLARQELTPYLYTYRDESSARHMFRVASGLDSMILGEPQILGQMKTAYQTASEAGTLGKNLGRLFQYTFSTAKRVRSDTEIGSSPVSVAFAAVRLAQQIFADFDQQTALLIGAGETIELTARHLKQQGIGRIIIANRTFDNAHRLAAQFDAYAIALSELPKHLVEADILVSSTASQLPILGKGSVESALKKRKHKPIFMVDLAVPRDIETEVEQLQDVYLYTVDDLKNTVQENIHSRRQAAQQAEEIISHEVDHFQTWLKSQSATPIIRDFRQQAETIRDEALQHAQAALNGGKPASEVLNLLAYRLTNRLIHTPSTQIKQASINERHDLIQAARELFELK